MTTYYKGYIMGYTNSICEDLNLGNVSIEKNDNEVIQACIREDNQYLKFFELFGKKIANALVNGEQKLVIEKKSVLDISHAISESLFIIFEKVVDCNGNVYGREIITGKYFLIPKEENFCNESYLTFTLHSFSELSGEKTYNTHLNSDACEIKVDELDKCGAFIAYDKIADLNEIEEYKRKSKKRSFIKKINILAGKNVFNREIIPMVKEEKKKENQNEETIIMENIECLLEKLDSISSVLKDKYQEEYDKLLRNGTDSLTITPINIVSLKCLEAKIEFDLTFNKSNNYSLKEYLENLKKEYLNNFLNNSEDKTNLTITDIDKLYEMFLKTKNNYSLVEQRNTIKDISFIYLFEVYENISNIDIEEIKDSYFSDNIKTILLIIKSLIKNEVIENNILIDFNKEYSLNDILLLINKIKFNANSNNKKRLLEK